jgi:butyryl-CoA dehydrogenase/short/branched chain acyl-CoA dehydrogenase
LKTRAVDKGDHYELTGQKLWITNGNEAEIFVLFATVDPDAGYKGITAFIVEKQFEGFSVGKKEDKLGIRASSTTELILDNCKVPKENVLGEVGKGYKVSIETLNEGASASARKCLVSHRERTRPLLNIRRNASIWPAIGTFQAVQFQLAEMAVDIEATRLLVYNAARLKDAGNLF